MPDKEHSEGCIIFLFFYFFYFFISKQQKFISPRSGGWNSKIKVLAGLVSNVATLPGVLVAVFSPYPHMCFLCVSILVSLPFLIRAPVFKKKNCCCYSVTRSCLNVIPSTAACQASLSFTISWSLLKLMSTESVMPSNHLVLCCPLLLLPSVFPSIRLFISGGQIWGCKLFKLIN